MPIPIHVNPGRFGGGRFSGGRFSGRGAGLAFSASISGLTSNATYGATAQIGVELTGTINGLEGGETVVHIWTLGGTPISGAASAAYTPVSGDDLGLIRYAPTVDAVPVLSAAYTARHAPPAQNAAPAASGDPVIGESLSGTAGTFTGADLAAVTNEWQISDDGATGWAGTGDTDTTGPAMASGRHYRLASTTSNSGGALTTCSSAIGPAVAPVISMSGLTGGDAVIGDHASIAMAADQGTITARKWGSTSGGSEYGTGTNPTDFAAGEGGTLYATATVGGADYTVPAGIAAPALDVAQNAGGTVDITMSEGTFSVTVSGSAISGHNGTHGPFDTADLDSGPVNVVPASISGTAEAGQVLTAAPGLWVWDTANGSISIAAIWQSDDADITGETGTAYTTAGGDLGTAIEYQETATDSAGSRVQDSNAITISAAATAPAAFTSGQWTAATGSGASEIDIGITTLPDDGGSAITALEYSVDAGTTWAALTGTGTGPRTVNQHSDGTTGTLTVSTSYNVEVRAVNAVDNGADSDTKATTSGAAASFTDPSSLGSKLIVWADATDFANLKQNDDGTGAVTAPADPVEYITDLSGNANHMKYAATAGVAQTGYLDVSGGDLYINGSTGFTTGMEAYALIEMNGDTTFALLGKLGAGAYYAGRVQDGTSAACDSNFGASVVHTVDNVDQSSPDTNTLHDALAAAGTWVALGARGLDLAGETLIMPVNTNSGYRFDGNLKHFVLTEALTTGERADLQTWFEGE